MPLKMIPYFSEVSAESGFDVESQFGPWDDRDVTIKDVKGNVIFSQNVKAPKRWSNQAVTVVAQKYLYGDRDLGEDPKTGGRENSIGQLAYRVAYTIADWASKDGYFDHSETVIFAGNSQSAIFARELQALILSQRGSFNSPVWFNVGLGAVYGLRGSENGWRWHDGRDSLGRAKKVGKAIPNADALSYPQTSACFIQGVDDNMASIMGLAVSEAMLFKYGSGTGSDLSTLRSSKEKLSGGGKPSGPVSFMEIYDSVAGVIKSGGRSRRAAKIQTLHVRHPDIVQFIDCKTKEDRKARALVAAGFSGGMEGDAGTVKFQNANLSVRPDNEFMEKCQFPIGDSRAIYETIAVTTGKPIESLCAATIIHKIAENAWECGDPGLQYTDTINHWHMIPAQGSIDSSNPCAEYLSINDSACNLASLNLMRFRKADGTFDEIAFCRAANLFIIAQDALIDHSSFPTKKIAENAHKHRELGLGYCGLGAFLMTEGLPYDSDAGRSLAGAITAILTASAYYASSQNAAVLGTFVDYEENRDNVNRIMADHAHLCVNGWSDSGINQYSAEIHRLWTFADALWRETVDHVRVHGLRNSQVTVCAPTGTISFMMESDHSSGVEPCLAVKVYKTLAGGGMIEVINPDIRQALVKLGYSEDEQSDITSLADLGNKNVATMMGEVSSILRYIEENGTIEGAPYLKPEHLPVFDCALPSKGSGRSIAPMGHVKMLGSIQRFISGSISKTCNLPNSATVEDIKNIYIEAWKLGVKAVAVYRDGSKTTQPVKTTKDDEETKLSDSPPIDAVGWPEEIATIIQNTLINIFKYVGGSSLSMNPEITPEFLADIENRVKLATQKVGRSGPIRDRLPDTRKAITHKGTIDGQEFYLTVGEYPDGRPGEIFLGMSKEGSLTGGMMDAFGTALSILLQYGVPLDILVTKFTNGRFPPMGFTKHPDIHMASSVVDYVMKFIDLNYGSGKPVEARDDRFRDLVEFTKKTASLAGNLIDIPPQKLSPHLCPACGNGMNPLGPHCWMCPNCREQVGGCG